MLPFLVPRIFRPIMIEAWELSNQEIGVAFSIYGISAMLSYILGGPLADKFKANILISLSLALTAFGGLLLLLNPSKIFFYFTYFYFGVSTILFMWGAMIKVTHEFGGESGRATMMGLLDGGRGLTAACMGMLLMFLSSKLIFDQMGQLEYAQILNQVLLIITVFLIVLAVACYFYIINPPSSSLKKWSIAESLIVLKRSETWLLSIIILCSYSAFKSIDLFSIYLVDIQNLSSVEASRLTSYILWLRPLGAIGFGLFVDFVFCRFNISRYFFLTLLLGLSSILSFLLVFGPSSSFIFVLVLLASSALFAFALRAIYFSVFGENETPSHLIGTTVGVVSLVGFMPDFFFGVIAGYFIDTFNGNLGYQYSFAFTGVLLMIGSLCSLVSLNKNS